MFKVILKTDARVFIGSKKDFRVFPVRKFKWVRNRKDKGTKIRKPVMVVVDGHLFIFTKKEWANGKKLALRHKDFLKDLRRVHKKEIQEKKDGCKKLAKQSDLRFKLEADAAGSQRSQE